MRPLRTSFLAVAALVLSAGGVMVGAQEVLPPAPRAPPPQTDTRQVRVSMDQAVRLAERRFNARVVRAETQMQGGRTIYVLRMLDGAGRVFAVRVDAQSGAIL